MEIKADRILPVKGLNKDFGEAIYSNEFLYNLINAKINRDEGTDLLTITSVKGTLLQSIKPTGKTVINGTVLGYSVIRQYLVIFAKGTTDYIYRFELHDDNTISEKLLYSGNFGFSLDAPIEAISNYESDDIIKTYWVDKNNLPRMINIVQESYRPSYISQFNFVPELELKEEYSVEKFYHGGEFHAGTVQYAFTYWNKNGAESNIFLTTGINSVSFEDRAGSKEEVCQNSFKIKITDVESDHFDYIRMYAIERHDLNGTPVVRQVLDYKLIPGNSTVELTDDGKLGATIDPNLLMYLGGENIHINTLEVKDNHLFGGNLKLNRPSLETLKGVQIYTSAEFVESDEVALSENRPSWQSSTFDTNSSVIPTYAYKPESLVKDSILGEYRGFKTGEVYRFGVQAQHSSGVWSEVLYLGKDFQVDRSLIEQKASDNKRDVINYKNIIFKVNLSPEFISGLIPIGYKKVRLVYVPLSKRDRRIISQGIVNSTLFNLNDNNSNRYGIYADYLTRVQPIRDNEFQHLFNTKQYYNIYAGALDFYLKQLNSFSFNFNFPKKYHANIVNDYKFAFEIGNDPFEVRFKEDAEYTYSGYSVNALNGPVTGYQLTDTDFTNGINPWMVNREYLNFYSPEIHHEYYNTQLFNELYCNIIGLVDLSFSNIGYDLIYNGKKVSYGTTFGNDKIAARYGGLTIYSYLREHDTWFESGSNNMERIRTYLKNLNTLANTKYGYSNIYNSTFNSRLSVSGNNDNDIIIKLKASYLWHEKGIKEDSNNYADSAGNYMLYKYQYRNLYFGNTYYFRINYKPTLNYSYQFKYKIGENKVVNHINSNNITIDNLSYSNDVKELLASLYKDASNDNMTDLEINSKLMNYKVSNHILFNLGEIIKIDYPVTLQDATPYVGNMGNYLLYKYPFTDTTQNYKHGLPITLSDVSFYASNHTVGERAETSIFHSTMAGKRGWLNNFTAQSDAFKQYKNRVVQPVMESFKQANPNLYRDEMIFGKRLDNLFLVDFERPVSNQYNGQKIIANQFVATDEALYNNIFIPCSDAYNILKLNTQKTIYATDGDTYIQRFDFPRVQPRTNEEWQQLYETLSYIGTSFINLDGRYDKYRYTSEFFAKHVGNYGLVNDAYSQLNNFFQYRTLDYNKLNDDNKSNAIIWSKQKYNQELTDKWLNLNMLSTHDVEGKYGKVNKILNFNDNILVFQDKGIANIIFNPRVQIPTSDGIPIEITNSGKLEGHKYVATNIGCINKWSIKASSSAVYFIDNHNKDIIRFSREGFENLTLTKNFTSWAKFFLNNNKEFTPANYDNFTTHIDLVTGDVYFNWLKVQEKDITDFDFDNYTYLDSLNQWHNKHYFSGSLVFDESNGYFENEFDYDNVPYMFNVNNNFYSIKNNSDATFSIHQMNVGNYSNFFGKYCPTHVDYYVAPDYSNNKIFHNSHLTMDVFEPNDVFIHNKMFNEVKVANQYQYNALTLIRTQGTDTLINPILRKKFNNWKFPLPRHYKTLQRFTNHWIRMKFKFDYPDNNYRMKLHELINYYTV